MAVRLLDEADGDGHVVVIESANSGKACRNGSGERDDRQAHRLRSARRTWVMKH